MKAIKAEVLKNIKEYKRSVMKLNKKLGSLHDLIDALECELEELEELERVFSAADNNE